MIEAIVGIAIAIAAVVCPILEVKSAEKIVRKNRDGR